MARPMKKGLDYFSLDVSFYRDIKLRKLVRRKGGSALTVYTILLCIIYENGYYLEWDDDLPFVISEATDFEEDKITDIINYCIEVGLFDQELYKSEHVLTSHGIQERYKSACSMTKRKLSPDLPYQLVSFSQNTVNSKKTEVTGEQSLVFSEGTPINSEETKDNSELSTQIKEKERKEKHSSSADIRAREEKGGWSGNDLQVCASVDEEITELRSSPIWKEQVFMRFKFLNSSEQMLDEYLTQWGIEVKVSGKCHQHIGDAKHHFMSWMIIQEDKFNNKGNGYGTNNNNGYRSREDIITGAVGIMQELRAEAQQSEEELPVV